ncbi:hypothetical protein BZG35_11825 [Brevundimonas sp. LM2]|uniref:DUF1353 domain-containing protein n=1 Tax=Brevundimonas sp. LM2 TaxID=1938605 RepID=UPI000983D736|nr:DUF1353 domain-containing protein [Brevundimonas sp. LM2]AQR62253.1 hypothetical protein BZG35_11825 [Brevundimonas sp. LM2]
MPFHAISTGAAKGRWATEANRAIRVEEPLVCAVNHDRARERHGRTTVVVLRPFAYTRPDGSRTVRVPPTYLTDFASIPSLARWIIPPFGRHAIAAVLHDWLYTIGQPGRRGEADDIFREALQELGVGQPRRSVMHAAVRAGGGGAYGRAGADWNAAFMDWRTGGTTTPAPAREAFFDDAWPTGVPTVDL